MRVALTRAVPPTITDCELTHLVREPIDLPLAIAQHAEYEATLHALGARVERVDAAPELPDSVFIEDAAVVFDEIAVLMRPGAASRRTEVDAVAAALTRYRPIHSIAAPGTMDGGDVLHVGRRVFVGVSRRTNEHAVRQLQAILRPLGYAVDGVPVEHCLHLKSAVTAAADDLLVLNPAWIDWALFGGVEWIATDPDEPSGANVVRVGDAVVCAASAPRTRERLEARGLIVRTAPGSELAKAEGALTCCSLIFTESTLTR
jgi:dimethylargininase